MKRRQAIYLRKIQSNDSKYDPRSQEKNGGTGRKIQEKFSKDLELKNKQTETNNTITEMKNTLEGICSRITEIEEWMNDLEDRMV